MLRGTKTACRDMGGNARAKCFAGDLRGASRSCFAAGVHKLHGMRMQLLLREHDALRNARGQRALISVTNF